MIYMERLWAKLGMCHTADRGSGKKAARGLQHHAAPNAERLQSTDLDAAGLGVSWGDKGWHACEGA